MTTPVERAPALVCLGVPEELAPHLGGLLDELRQTLDELAAGMPGDEPSWVAGEALGDGSLPLISASLTWLADRLPREMKSLRLAQVERRSEPQQESSPPEVTLSMTALTDAAVYQLLLRRGGDDPVWDAALVRAPLGACVVYDAHPQATARVLLTSASPPLVASLRWVDADRWARPAVAGWVGDPDQLRGAVYRAQAGCGFDAAPTYRDLATAEADLEEITDSAAFRAQWPEATVPALSDDAPADTRAVTVIIDGRAEALALNLDVASRLTLIHELAHVLTPHAAEAHDESFVAVFLELLEMFAPAGLAADLEQALADERSEAAAAAARSALAEAA